MAGKLRRSWFYPSVEALNNGTHYPNSRVIKFYTCLERLDTEGQDQIKGSCFYAPDQKKLNAVQEEFDYDFFGRIIKLQDDVVIWRGKMETYRYIPLYKKGRKIVLDCIDFPGTRALIKPDELIVITDQMRANVKRKSQKWTYTTQGRQDKLKLTLTDAT